MKRRRAFEVVAALLLGASAWFAFAPKTGTVPTPTSDVAATTSAESKTEPPRATQRKRGADAKAEESEATPPADDPAKWPIRVMTNVPGATVTMQVSLFGGDPDPAPETKTTDAGGFVGFAAPAEGVPVHEFAFVARAEGWTTAYATRSEPGEVKVMLHPAVAIRGFVRDENGRGIGGASVSFQGSTFTANERRTSADGSFEVFAEKAGEVWLDVRRLGFEPPPARVAVEAPAAGLIIVLRRGAQVSGRVSFPSGLPVPGVRVSVHDLLGTTTDADGRYVLTGLAPGQAEVACEGVDEMRHVEAPAVDVNFVVKRSIARIRFLDEKGRPFRLARTSIRMTKDGDVLLTSGGQAPDDGVELADGPAGAQVAVSARAPDGRIGYGAVTFDETPRVHDVDVVLGAPRATGTIRLVVRWEAPETPRSAYVDVTNEARIRVAGNSRFSTDLDAAGAVEIPNVPAGRVTVSVAAKEYWSAQSFDTWLVTTTPSADVEAGRTTELVATLVTGGRVRATVKDADGKAIAPDSVLLRSVEGDRFVGEFVRREAGGGWTSRLDASPSDLIDAVAPGRYVVVARGDDGETGRKEVDVVRGETVDVEVVVKAATK